MEKVRIITCHALSELRFHSDALRKTQMMKPLWLVPAAILALLPHTSSAQYQGWQHSGSLYILTTPEGADLPATASESGFPLLVRLHKDFFDFSQAKAHGEDLRFATGAGRPLAYEIDEWDPANGMASIWVRMPTIKGNARQEIKLFWGKPDAASESNGSAVFNASNGYLSVWHMNDPVKDEVGTIESKDTGTSSAPGIIGRSRHFPGKPESTAGRTSRPILPDPIPIPRKPGSGPKGRTPRSWLGETSRPRAKW